MGGIADQLSKMANDAREQLYDMSEQLRTGQTVYDRSQVDVFHHEPEQPPPEQERGLDMGGE